MYYPCLQTARRPDKLVVVVTESGWSPTYEELGRRANQLAHRNILGPFIKPLPSFGDSLLPA